MRVAVRLEAVPYGAPEQFEGHASVTNEGEVWVLDDDEGLTKTYAPGEWISVTVTA